MRVNTGTENGSQSFEGNQYSREIPSLETLTPLADGGFRAIFSRELIDYAEGDAARDDFGMDVESRTIDAAGRQVKADLWTLAESAPRPMNPDSNSYEAPYTVSRISDEGDTLTLIGRRFFGPSRRYTLLSGGRLRSAAIANKSDALPIEAVLPDRRGGFYVYNVPGTDFNMTGVMAIQHIRADGSPDHHFGRRGSVGLRDSIKPLTVDPDGRLIALIDDRGEDPRIARFTI